MKPAFEDMSLQIPAATAEPEDYTGEDGLLYCGKCRTPKEAYFPADKVALFGRDRHPAECDCQRAQRMEREAAEQQRKHRDKVEELKRLGFTDPAMREWTFANDNGRKPLLFGGGSPDTSGSEDLSGVQFINGTRPGNPQLVELAKSQVGNVGGYPYWSWYGFDSRVEWCACFVSWCYNQAGKSEPRFAGCEWQGVPWFQSHGQWGARGYENIAPGDAIFFDWDLDGSADHVGIVVGTDGSRVYTVEGNSGDACKIKSYDLNYQSIKGYGLMNW